MRLNFHSDTDSSQGRIGAPAIDIVGSDLSLDFVTLLEQVRV